MVKASVPRIISGIFRAGLTSQGFDNTGSTIRRGFRAGVKLYGLGVCCHVTITRSTKKITYVIMQALVVTIPKHHNAEWMPDLCIEDMQNANNTTNTASAKPLHYQM